MQNVTGRRRFLKTMVAGGLAGAGMDVIGGSALADLAPVAEAAEPSSNMPRLLAGCCAYSYRMALTHGQMTMEDFIRKSVELQLDSIDMTVYYLKSTDRDYLNSLRHLAYQNAITLSGTACRSSLVQPDADRRKDALQDLKKWVDVADALGTSHLRIFAGKLPDGVPLQEATGWVVEGMKAGCDYAAQKGVILGLEDHSGVSQSADVCLEIMHRVNSPYAAINLDITHFIPSATQDGYAQIAACIPYAKVVHVRDVFDDGSPLDMDRVWRLFAKARFKGYMSVEYDGEANGGEPAATGVPKLVKKTRELCRKYSTV